MDFNELELDERLLHATDELGFSKASPIQEKAIPCVLEGNDIIGQAQTGTGKTAAFGLPMLQKMDPENRALQGLILCPTRELAIQVAEELRKLAKYMHGIKVVPVYGGQEISRQIVALKKGATIVIGTPGRIMDHMRRHTIHFDHLSMVTLDEADEMLNMGFREDIETILKETPETRQTLLFSATMPKEIMEIARTYQKDAQIIKVVSKDLTVDNITQLYYNIKPTSKVELLCRLLDLYNPNLSIVFTNTKRGADELVRLLQARGHGAEALHGDLKQQQRDRVMNGFRHGINHILVATDVAARGIDVDDVDAVFNFDLPQDNEYYVHRIGRTGRAGKKGYAFSFVPSRDISRLKEIQRYCKTTISPAKPPSRKDLRNACYDRLFTSIEECLAKQDMDAEIERLKRKLEDKDYDALTFAAALMQSQLGIGKTYDEDIQEDVRNSFERTRSPRSKAYNGSKPEGSLVRLFLNIGKNSRIRPGDILGAITGEVGIPGKKIGEISMHDRFSFIEVPKDYANKILRVMNKVKIKGKSIHMELANKK